MLCCRALLQNIKKSLDRLTFRKFTDNIDPRTKVKLVRESYF